MIDAWNKEVSRIFELGDFYGIEILRSLISLCMMTDHYIYSAGVIDSRSIEHIINEHVSHGVGLAGYASLLIRRYIAMLEACLSTSSFTINQSLSDFEPDHLISFVNDIQISGCVVMLPSELSSLKVWCSDPASVIALRMRFGGSYPDNGE